ncbi:MAG TPA: DUF362 domain-containing protein [Kofleriaceae bacterium]|nr:DUF362 domain-containing protein [Kofleriaceae bacterium]
MFRVIGFVAVLGCACGTSTSPPAPGSASGAPPPVSVDAAPVLDAVSAASPKWEPGPAVVVQASDKIDGAALRDKNRKRLAEDRSPVTLLTGGTALELGQRLCEAVVPKRPPETPVLLKPNLGGFNWFRDPAKTGGDNGVTGRITDPEFTRGVVRCLKARGHTKITIADGFTGKAADWVRLAKVSGYAEMAKQEGVALVALDDDGVFDVEGEQPGKPLGITGIEHTKVPTLLIAKGLADHLQHGLYISLPKIKAHRYAVFSLGIKAMQGNAMYSDATPAFRQKWRTHREIDRALALVKKDDPKARDAYVKSLEIFAERIADILELEAPDVVLAEGAPAMQGDGFVKLEPTPEPVAIGGTNVILVDRVGAEYLGLWNNDALGKELGGHKTSPLLEVAAKRFGVDLAKPKVIGNGAELLGKPRAAHLIGMANFEIGGEPPGEVVDTASLPKQLHAAHVTEPPTIDGQLDPAFAAAKPLAFATDWAGHATKTPTQVRALWSATGLYLYWELDGASTFTDQSRPIADERVDLYEENCVELFLVPDPANKQRYFEIELGPFGHFFDILVDRTKKPRADNSWSAKLRIATTRDEARQHAVIEVAIESPDVVAALTAGAQLPLGLYRMEGQGKRQYLAAFPTKTPRPSFHVPEAFGTLVLDP